jgi:hypothetical protein
MPTGELHTQLTGRLFFTGVENMSMKQTYWLVESSYYDDGTVQVRLAGSIQAKKRPENEKLSTSEADIYRDWKDIRRLTNWLLESIRSFEPVPLRRQA